MQKLLNSKFYIGVFGIIFGLFFAMPNAHAADTCGVNLFNPQLLTEADFKGRGDIYKGGRWDYLKYYVSTYPFGFAPGKSYKLVYTIDCDRPDAGEATLAFVMQGGAIKGPTSNVCQGRTGSQKVSFSSGAGTVEGMTVKAISGEELPRDKIVLSEVMVVLDDQDTSSFIAYNPCIKIATENSLTQRVTGVKNRLTSVNGIIDSLIAQSDTNTTGVGTLFTGKQNRPITECPIGWKCLLVKDETNIDNWYPIVESVSTVEEVDTTGTFTPKFSVTTTNLTSNTVFKFYISAQGSFVVDWGDGTRESIDRSAMLTPTEYTHTYTTAGVKTIGFDGTPTAYNSSYGAISFDTNFDETRNLVASVTSGLGALFPTLTGGGDDKVPSFSRTFLGQTNLTSVPAGLFTGATGHKGSMFSETFAHSGLTSIPATLFDGISGAADGMFVYTFYNCENLNAIPEGLFSHITGGAQSMFFSTFALTNISSIPANLFNGITTSEPSLFAQTFYGCNNLTSIPANLFSNLSGSAASMFEGTFADTGISTIPSNLFSHITGGAYGLFWGTFMDCENLTTLPANLFSGITEAHQVEFYRTFVGCPALTGYIPASMFSGLINNGSPEVWMFMSEFMSSNNLATTCPSGTTQVETGYEQYWYGKVACQSNS